VLPVISLILAIIPYQSFAWVEPFAYDIQ
jgi:hypothetical protein